ncbi:MAG TPA: hypothetical protein IAB39_09925 [Candidatus Onthovicinus excrementipullorum]|nr:hypothetical protein [Candidatus Onthovicinus excrementipullorum]
MSGVRRRTPMFRFKKNEHGVVSLEACIVLPIFIFVLMFFYGLMVFFSGHQLLSHSLIQSAESLSLDPYATERLNISWDEMEGGKDLVQAMYADAFSSQDPYFSSNEKWYAENSDLLIPTVRKRFLGYLVGSGTSSEVEKAADEKLKTIGVQNGLSGLDFSETKVEDGVLTITIKYRQEFVFNFQGLAAFDRQQTITITLWDVAEGTN